MAITLAIPSRRFCAQRLPERGALNRRQSRTACDSLHQVRVTRSRGRVSAGRSLVAASSLALKIRRLAGNSRLGAALPLHCSAIHTASALDRETRS